MRWGRKINVFLLTNIILDISTSIEYNLKLFTFSFLTSTLKPNIQRTCQSKSGWITHQLSQYRLKRMTSRYESVTSVKLLLLLGILQNETFSSWLPWYMIVNKQGSHWKKAFSITGFSTMARYSVMQYLRNTYDTCSYFANRVYLIESKLSLISQKDPSPPSPEKIKRHWCLAIYTLN